MSEESRTKVVIIGAGIAGLIAAKTFLEYGVTDFVVLEAQDYVGGRIKTEYSSNGVIEYGAQWLHGSHNKLSHFAEACDMLSNVTSLEGEGKYIRDDGYIFSEKQVADVDFIVGKILSDCEQFKDRSNAREINVSVGEYLEQEFNKYLQRNISPEQTSEWRQLFYWHLKFQNIDNSCESLNTLSARHWGDYDFNGNTSQGHVNFNNGYSEVVQKLRKMIPDQLIFLQKPVRKIFWNSPSVRVVCSDNFAYLAEHVICTVSLGILKAELATMFVPQLPARTVTAINSLGFGAMAKIFLEFEFPWWEDNKGFQIVWDLNKQAGKWYSDISGFDVLNVGTPNTLLGWVGSKGTKIMEMLSEDTVAKDCIELLKQVTGLQVAPLRKIKRTTWYSNPYVRGGYSHITVDCDINQVKPSSLAEPVMVEKKPVLLFAGEACHDSHFSTTHGAYESGEEQASFLCNYILTSTPK